MTAGRNIISRNKEWCTPQKYVAAVREVFGGGIALDPCSNPHSVVGAKVEYMFPQNDGLRDSWNYPNVYVNPPYGIDKENGSSIKDWIKRCADAHEMHGSEVIALIPVAVNTSHWKQHVFGRAQMICFLGDTRLKFLENGSEGEKGAPMACAMVYWGRDPEKFYEVFIGHGAVVSVGHLNKPYRQRSLSSYPDDAGQAEQPYDVAH
ncbi:MAG: phage N-6-adenine-methyltransferase [Methanomassiliicoccaceae archaeon]|nr:phage N-6-adenine-methyltransferase [Methanomassiliicoccaceae archaeon]